jgi:hypothetical protein
MKSVRDILRDADPVSREPGWNEADRDRLRRAVAIAASETATASAARFRAPLALVAAVVLIVVGILAVGSRSGPHGNAIVYAAVRFEVRLAEDHAAAGLREVRVSADRMVYLHEEIVVTNADIERSEAVPGSTPSRFNIHVQLNPRGAAKMRQATTNHVGRPMAVLIDGEVVMAPVLRDPIGASALISGDFSRAEADRIVNGIGVR